MGVQRGEPDDAWWVKAGTAREEQQGFRERDASQHDVLLVKYSLFKNARRWQFDATCMTNIGRVEVG